MAGNNRRSQAIKIEVANKDDCTETESSFFRALENEDLKRFGVSDGGNAARPVNEIKNVAVKNDERHGRKGERALADKWKALQRKGTKTPQTRIKHTRFVQRRASSFHDSAVARGWHSDSELESIGKERESKAKHARKSRNGNTCERGPANIAERARVSFRLGLDEAEKTEEKKCHSGRHADNSGLDRKELRDINRDSLKKDLLDASLSSVNRGGGPSGENRLINLLIEYFRDLNKDIIEFREERKKTHEKIQDIEVKLEKLNAKVECRETPFEKQKARIPNNMGTGIDFIDRSDIKQEIRSIISEVHNKYHRQLVEHEVRMKYVQEKAELDLKSLMRSIVSNYAPIPPPKAGKTERSQDLSETLSDKHSDGKGRIPNVATPIVSGDKWLDNCQYIKTNAGKGEPMTKDVPEKNATSKRFWPEEARGKYEFYFPKESRDKKEEGGNGDKSQEKSPKAGMCEAKLEVSPPERLQSNSTQHSERKLVFSDPPPGLGASYLEWKKFWCEKLQQRNAGIRTKACTVEEKETDPNRNTS